MKMVNSGGNKVNKVEKLTNQLGVFQNQVKIIHTM